MGLMEKLETLHAGESVALLRSDVYAEEVATKVLPRMLTANHLRVDSDLAKELVELMVLLYRLGYERGKVVKKLNEVFTEERDEE